jgi:hypothetical protein
MEQQMKIAIKNNTILVNVNFLKKTASMRNINVPQKAVEESINFVKY